ncbi:hypothetical protein Zmor_004192 [Zophobas morio]|uniref:Uncharacterized protein n=1 Tax=Zophobas morio TaxID=2755281 RepID=A0AA38M152_9CUCU|nr:hypothetical protein Zmor_004192 [Zophobas morio]
MENRRSKLAGGWRGVGGGWGCGKMKRRGPNLRAGFFSRSKSALGAEFCTRGQGVAGVGGVEVEVTSDSCSLDPGESKYARRRAENDRRRGRRDAQFSCVARICAQKFFWFGNVPRASLEWFWRPTGARWWFREEREGCARDGDLQVVVTRRVT